MVTINKLITFCTNANIQFDVYIIVLFDTEISLKIDEIDIMQVVEAVYTPPRVKESAQNATLELLPSKSREVYENSYARFMNWRKEEKVASFSEDVIIAYLANLSTKVKPSTLWGHYSMLKATLNVKHGVNIKNYPKVVPYLKRKSDGYKPKKSKTLTKEEINKFLSEAPDNKYLFTKV